MTFVVGDNCIKCKHTDCVEVCPVDCFYEGPNMLVIHPDECIDCALCEPECPAEAIFSEDELRQIVDLCEKLGASHDQADTMAKQLIKRVDQWVEERGMDRVEATKALLELVVSGRQGIAPPGFEGEIVDKSDQADKF